MKFLRCQHRIGRAREGKHVAAAERTIVVEEKLFRLRLDPFRHCVARGLGLLNRIASIAADHLNQALANFARVTSSEQTFSDRAAAKDLGLNRTGGLMGLKDSNTLFSHFWEHS